MKKILLAVMLAAFTFSGVVKADEHRGEHREFHGERHGHDLGWLIGGAILGGIIVHESERSREYQPPMRRVMECRDVVFYDYNGYEHVRRECREVYVPVEE